MKIYTGYIVGKNETNPVSVWIPAKHGFSALKPNKGFGSNAGNLDLLDLSYARMRAEKCYYSTELSSQGPYIFDDSNGFATKEDNIAFLDETTVKDVRENSTSVNRYFIPGEGTLVQTPHANPAVNFLQTFYPMPAEGTIVRTYMNAPGGNYATLGIGTKVLIVYPDSKNIGYIIRQIPYDDEMSKVIKNLAED